MTTKSVNGIDLDRLRATRDLIETDTDGSLANPKYESTIVWNSGYRTVSRVTGQEVIGDEPERYGGSGVGITRRRTCCYRSRAQLPGIITPDDRPVVLGDQEFPDAPRLYFIGHVNPLSGQLREIRLEAGRNAAKLGKQLATRYPGKSGRTQSLQMAKE